MYTYPGAGCSVYPYILYVCRCVRVACVFMCILFHFHCVRLYFLACVCVCLCVCEDSVSSCFGRVCRSCFLNVSMCVCCVF